MFCFILQAKRLRDVFKAQSRPFYDTQKNIASGRTALSVKNPDRQLQIRFPHSHPVKRYLRSQGYGENLAFTLKRFMTTNIMFPISD